MRSPENEPAERKRVSARDAADRRARLFGYGISIGLHVALVALYALRGVVWNPPEGRVGLSEPEESTLSGTQIVNLVELEPEDPEAERLIELITPDAPRVIVPSITTDPVIAAVDPGAEGDDGPDPIHAAEVFRVRMTDPRLWIVARADLLNLTPAEREEFAIMGRLERWNDSVNAAMAAEAALYDWTATDGDGGKWGISPGKLHLGKITIPLPFGFGPNPWQAEQIAKRQARDDDIARGAASQAVRASWKERAEAIRARKDRERRRAEERRRGGDTTRSRRGGG